MATKFTEVTTQQAAATLARDFIGLADDLRDLLTFFGLRSYRVSLVKVRWSGGRRGRGVADVYSVESILPTPKIAPLNGVAELAMVAGLTEVGAIELSQVSGRFTEDELLGRIPQTGDVPLDEEFFYEVEFFPQEGPTVKRRFIPKSVPAYQPGRLQWTVTLEKANRDRERDGDVR